MALFGSNKKEDKKSGGKRVRSTRAAKLPQGRAHDVIRAPWFSEKALIATDKGTYAFAIPKDATKAHVAAAIKEIYNVAPRKVRIVNLPRKKVSTRTGRGSALRAARRKAYVYLKEGDTIQFA